MSIVQFYDPDHCKIKMNDGADIIEQIVVFIFGHIQVFGTALLTAEYIRRLHIKQQKMKNINKMRYNGTDCLDSGIGILYVTTSRSDILLDLSTCRLCHVFGLIQAGPQCNEPELGTRQCA